MKRKIFKISIIAIICILLLQMNIFASNNITIETTTNGNSYAVGGTVIATVDWGVEMQAVGFTLRYNSTKLSLKETSVNDNFYNISDPILDEISGDYYTDVGVNWASLDNNKKTNITFTFKTLASGNATIEVNNAEPSKFANENLESPEQVDYTTKGSKTIKINTLGDVNLDGIINLRDVIKLNQYVANVTELNEEALINADVCADDVINQLDVDILNKHVAGWAVSFPFIYGDANCDGKVDINDATSIQKHLSTSYSYELSREGLNRADVNLDGQVDDFDRLAIQRHLAEMQQYARLPVKIVTNSDIRYSIIDNKIVMSGFNISNSLVSMIKQQLSNDLSIDVYNINEEKVEDDKLLGTGYNIKIDEKTIEEVPESLAGIIGEYTSVIYGDTTGDGKINAIDALALIKDINNKIEFPSEVYRQAGRIVSSNDQDPTAVDALAIIKHANGKYEISQVK